MRNEQGAMRHFHFFFSQKGLQKKKKKMYNAKVKLSPGGCGLEQFVNIDERPRSAFSTFGLHVKMAWFRFLGKNSLVRCTWCGQDYVTIDHTIDSKCRCCGGKNKFIRYTHEHVGMRT
jgi:hypothetical protein